MPVRYRILTTPPFDRDAKRAAKKYNDVRSVIERAIFILESDPYNLTREHNIKKLEGIKKGDGVYRLRIHNFRIRYDTIGNDIVLYSFRDRKEAYR